MTEVRLDNRVRQERERLGLSQQGLAERVGVSRQAIIAIEAGKSVPSTVLGLRIARALRSRVEDLFSLSSEAGIAARLAPGEAPLGDDPIPSGGARVALGEVGGRWVAHRLTQDASVAADGLIAAEASGRTAVVRPLADLAQLRRNVLVAGCAPLLGGLANRVGEAPDARATWLPASSGRALELLEDGLIHVAGVHFGDAASGQDNASRTRRALPGTRALLVALTRWRLGLVVPAGNPLRIRSGSDLLRPGLRLARREEGAGAHKLVMSLLAAEGVERSTLPGPFAAGHAEVAQLVRFGAADVGVAIEGVALAAGLGFVPLIEERFDLVVRADLADSAPVSRLLETLDDPGFRADAAQLPGYDVESCGHVTTLEAA